MRRIFIVGGIALGVVVFGAMLTAWWLLRGSLPQLDGRAALAAVGPRADVVIERDADGVVTVRGADHDDVAYGLGYAHAQDRFFQMDLARRLAAGELAELLGASVGEQDRRARIFRLRAVARRVIAEATPAQRAWIMAYAAGVNAGLESLQVRPWEYLLLRQNPAAWRAEDSVLVIHSMWWFLQYQALIDDIPRHEIATRIEQRVAAASRDEADSTQAATVMQFLFPRGDEWDAPNFQTLADQAAANGGAPYAAPSVPAPDLIDLRSFKSGVESAVAATTPAARSREQGLPGSNAWAVAGQHTRSGAALIAGDMHLGLRVPATWYRARLQVASETSASNGVTLPGLPGLVAGSNGRIAWSFTNSYGDWGDTEPVDCDPARNVYTTAQGERSFRIHRESMLIAGSEPEVLVVRDSPLGVVIRIDPPAAGSKDLSTCWMARWVITQPGATTLAALELQRATDVDAALSIAPQVGIPHQNFVVGDRSGRIAWTLIGRIPRTSGPSTSSPATDWLTAGETPVIREPEIGRIWSANSRHVEGPFEVVLGNEKAAGGMHYDKGARQRQIRDRLLALDRPATVQDMLAIQLDDRALMVERWQRLLLATLDEDAVRDHAGRTELRRLVGEWTGHAAVDSVGYRYVREFRERTRDTVWKMITQALEAGEGSTAYPLFEGSLWRLVSEQPPHMLSADYADWRSLLLQQADAVIADARQACSALDRCTWGAYNTTAVRHPLSRALGPLARFLDMPALPVAGDLNVPRVAGPTFGASERFAVSPGHESEGYMQLPGGASGHPLSPFYRAGFKDWVEGRPKPLLPGPAVHTLVVPAGNMAASARSSAWSGP